MTQPKIEAEELPYFTLLQKIPIKFIAWADKEVPTTYVIGNCSNNPATYNRSVELKKKADFYKALKSTIKPQAKVTVNYEEAEAKKMLPQLEASRQVELKFEGKDILSRQGISDRLADFDPQYKYLLTVKKVLQMLQKFIDMNKGTIQKMLKKNKLSSPWQVLRELMKDDTMKLPLFQMIGTELGEEAKNKLLQKWETANE